MAGALSTPDRAAVPGPSDKFSGTPYIYIYISIHIYFKFKLTPLSFNSKPAVPVS